MTRDESEKQAEAGSQKVWRIVQNGLLHQMRLKEDHVRCKLQKHDHLSLSQQPQSQGKSEYENPNEEIMSTGI